MDEVIKVGARINGLTTFNSYLVLAITKVVRGNNAFGVRNLGGNCGKIHYWPSAEAFKLVVNPDYANSLYTRDQAGHSIGTYEGVQEMPWDQIGRLLDKLREHDDFEVMSSTDYQAYLTSIGQQKVRTGEALTLKNGVKLEESVRASSDPYDDGYDD